MRSGLESPFFLRLACFMALFSTLLPVFLAWSLQVLVVMSLVKLVQETFTLLLSELSKNLWLP